MPLARLHLARGEYEEAIGVAGIGVRHMGDDRVRAARLLGIVVQAQLTPGDSTGQPGDLAIIQSLVDHTCAPRPARLVNHSCRGQLTRAGKAAITAADPDLTAHWPHRVETIENSIGTGWLSGAEKSNNNEDSDFESC